MIRGKGKQKKEYDRRRNADEKRKQEKAENRRKKMDGPTTLCSGKRGTRSGQSGTGVQATEDGRPDPRRPSAQGPRPRDQGLRMGPPAPTQRWPVGLTNGRGHAPPPLPPPPSPSPGPQGPPQGSQGAPKAPPGRPQGPGCPQGDPRAPQVTPQSFQS